MGVGIHLEWLRRVAERLHALPIGWVADNRQRLSMRLLESLMGIPSLEATLLHFGCRFRRYRSKRPAVNGPIHIHSNCGRF